MPARKRTTSRSRLNRAVRAGRSALAQAQRRVPPDLRRQIDRSIKDGQRRFDSTVKDIRTRVNQAAKQADLNKALKRLDGLSKQVQQLARKVTSGSTPAARSRRRPRVFRTRGLRPAGLLEGGARPTVLVTFQRDLPRKPEDRRACPAPASPSPTLRSSHKRRRMCRRGEQPAGRCR